MIRVFIVDDHPVVIEGLHSLLQNEKGIEWAGHAMNASSCLGFFINNTADVLLMDINMPEMDGIELCSVIKNKYPGIFILGLSTFNQGIYIKKMMENGASGYILKNSSRDELLKAIQTVNNGGIYFSGEAGDALKEYQKSSGPQLPELSRREKEILGLIAEGYTNPQIAEKLFLSSFTVDSHRKNLLAKLDVKNTATLIRLAVERKLI
ncbi:response regulator [Flavihumibacter profundi]|uniref:response regulator n=1 Tax=Flavihumibacter profundi TaxID=2716883 RepID=UPI001CC411E5|nr:response regulator transcription factor [Flavihumibacter profundi]MBZ5857701.1 response regulator transcription factor [Flavihumibacter profundi]